MQMLRTYLMTALLAATALTLSGCDRFPSKEYTESVAQTLRATLPNEFSQLEFTERPEDSREPTLVYTGRHSILLAATKPRYFNGLAGPGLSMTGLARTQNGRYFEFHYVSQFSVPNETVPYWSDRCTTQPQCRYFSDQQPLSADQAKAWFVQKWAAGDVSQEKTEAIYQELFHEAPPRERRIPA